MKAFLNSLVLLTINVVLSAYRAFGSLWLSGSCRFEPSCSVYAQEAIDRHGVWYGGKLAAIRLWRCRPGGPFGEDPVPLERERSGDLKCQCEGVR